MQLTPREKDVIDLLLEGEPNKVIAHKLGVKIETVKLHMRNICRKLRAKNRTHAVILLLNKGIDNE